MTNRKAALLSLVINVFFLTLCLVFGDLVFGAIDDFFMARILEGVYGDGYNVHLTFVNVLYGYVLLPFYHLFPKIGWYYVGEMFAVFVALTFISFVLIRRLGACWGLLTSVLMVAALASDYYLVLQFTQCAAVLSVAGGLFLWQGFNAEIGTEKSSRIFIVIGSILLLWGSMMRFEAFLMGSPFLILMFVSRLKQKDVSRKKLLACFACLLVLIFSSLKFNQAHYESPVYKNYMDFQGPRAVFSDGGNYDEQTIYEDMEELGLFGSDFGYLKAWTFYDNKVFSSENLVPILKLVKQYTYGLNLYYLPGGLLGTIVGASKSPIFLLWFLFCIGSFISEKKNLGYVGVSLFCVLLAFTYLLYVGRFVYRVENGLWLYAAVFMATKVGALPCIPKKYVCSFVALFCLVNAFLFSEHGTEVRSVNDGKTVEIINRKDTIDYKGFFDYASALDDSALILVPHSQYMELSFHREPVYLAAEQGSWKKFIPMGFWTPKFPDIENHIHSVGVTNPFEDVVKKNVFVLNNPNMGSFLKNHYDDDVKVEKIKDFNGMPLYKYSLVEDAEK